MIKTAFDLTTTDILSCSGRTLSIDTETNGLRWYADNKVIGVGIYCPSVEVAGYAHTCSYEDRPFGKTRLRDVPTGERDFSKSKRGRTLTEKHSYQPETLTAIPLPERICQIVGAVEKIASNPKTTLIGHNIKFDLHMMGLKSWQLPCRIIDTSVMVHLYDSRLLVGLEASERQFLGSASKRQHIEQADPRFKTKAWLWGPQVLTDYCLNDCIVTHQLAMLLWDELEQRDLLNLFSLQMRYLRLLQKMESKGILIQTQFCEEAIKEFDANLVSLEKELYDTIGYEFNWRSNSQLSKAIYEDLGIEKPTDPFINDEGYHAGHRAVAKLYTESATSTPLLVREKHPLTGLILDIRETDKLRDYARKYIELRDEQGFLHASFNQAKTLTGRLSSSEPNLQNLPSEKRKVDIESKFTGGAIRQGGYNLRQALVARPGYKLVSIDHKQQEMRLLAILSEEPVMLEAMRNREDIHLRVAIRVWGDCGPERNKLHREWSKAISFGLIYGLSQESLQEYFNKLGITVDAGEVKDQYFDAFPGLKPWFDRVTNYVRQNSLVKYWSGRYWYGSPEEAYKGINALIQGGCADFMSVVALRIDQVLTAQGWGSMLSIIHDEILLEVEEGVLEEALPVLAAAMEGEDIFDIPFATDVEVGDSYGTLKGVALQREPGEVNWREYA